jgi:hypothetical protein
MMLFTRLAEHPGARRNEQGRGAVMSTLGVDDDVFPIWIVVAPRRQHFVHA